MFYKDTPFISLITLPRDPVQSEPIYSSGQIARKHRLIVLWRVSNNQGGIASFTTTAPLLFNSQDTIAPTHPISHPCPATRDLKEQIVQSTKVPTIHSHFYYRDDKLKLQSSIFGPSLALYTFNVHCPALSYYSPSPHHLRNTPPSTVPASNPFLCDPRPVRAELNRLSSLHRIPRQPM